MVSSVSCLRSRLFYLHGRRIHLNHKGHGYLVDFQKQTSFEKANSFLSTFLSYQDSCNHYLKKSWWQFNFNFTTLEKCSFKFSLSVRTLADSGEANVFDKSLSIYLIVEDSGGVPSDPASDPPSGSLQGLQGLEAPLDEKLGLLSGDEEEELDEEEALIWSHFSPRALAKWSSTETLTEIRWGLALL